VFYQPDLEMPRAYLAVDAWSNESSMHSIRGRCESPWGWKRAGRRSLKGKQGLIFAIKELSFAILRPQWKYDNSEGFRGYESSDPRELSFSSTVDVC
jgi:hypothetical protein